eukprot:TRINITY_DN3880_c0_g1_i3.p1 TRINITY_DN3880_c0_g1~~TRINITY_DN3880_c0_g1_i3.p1  ORF type:complete len:490 (-),score=90.36 TRINITY_DN3880_c0_g1_i3:65-1534(-)
MSNSIQGNQKSSTQTDPNRKSGDQDGRLPKDPDNQEQYLYPNGGFSLPLNANMGIGSLNVAGQSNQFPNPQLQVGSSNMLDYQNFMSGNLQSGENGNQGGFYLPNNFLLHSNFRPLDDLGNIFYQNPQGGNQYFLMDNGSLFDNNVFLQGEDAIQQPNQNNMYMMNKNPNFDGSYHPGNMGSNMNGMESLGCNLFQQGEDQQAKQSKPNEMNIEKQLQGVQQYGQMGNSSSFQQNMMSNPGFPIGGMNPFLFPNLPNNLGFMHFDPQISSMLNKSHTNASTSIPGLPATSFLDTQFIKRSLPSNFLLDPSLMPLNASTLEKMSINQEKLKAERKAKIERYKQKRRIWLKKIAYDCRKRVADSRMRIKGRFISKKETENIEKIFGNEADKLYNDKKNLKLDVVTNKLKLDKASKKDLMVKINEFLNKNQRTFYTDEDTLIVKNIQQKRPIFRVIREDRDFSLIDNYILTENQASQIKHCLLYTSPSPRDS